jgi:hypothetical protein
MLMVPLFILLVVIIIYNVTVKNDRPSLTTA